MPVITLRDQTVVVIGGSSGMGYAVAEGALADGARVVIGSSSQANVAAAVKRLGAGASGAVADVKDEDTIAAFFDTTGEIDHLVFTAGDQGRGSRRSRWPQLDIAAAGEGLNVRFWGAMIAIKHAQERMAANGSITLTGGLMSHLPMKGLPLVSAFGGAIEHLVKGLAVDLAPIRVNAVCPGLVMTEPPGAAWPAEMVRQFTGRQPIAQGADPAEVAQAYLYLMRGGYTTGQTMIVDGGAMLV